MTQSGSINHRNALDGTPYVVPTDRASSLRFDKAVARSVRTRRSASQVQRILADRAAGMLKPLRDVLREELVAESNRIEGYDWDQEAVRAVAQAHKELLFGPVHNFVRGIQDDPRVYEALGLYRAHVLAEEWADSGNRPREFEIRQLHSLITAGESYAGDYKTKSNSIAGSKHQTTEPLDVSRAMSELANWWQTSSSDPVLDATVVHAWITHIHPFEDGNGRMARLLANLTLVQAGYPPLIISSLSDRGQYYDGLARSDDGDILPLYDLFTIVVRRTMRIMAAPGYVNDLLHERLLSSSRRALPLWTRVFSEFHDGLSARLEAQGWFVQDMGRPDVRSYELLRQRSSAGNSWYLILSNASREAAFLLWFGFTSHSLAQGRPAEAMFPSIYVSMSDEDPTAVHPFRWLQNEHGLPSEILVSPLGSRPVTVRHGSDVEEYSIADAVEALATEFTTFTFQSTPVVCNTP